MYKKVINNCSIEKISIILYLFFAFFPYLCFYKIGTDTQPYFLVFGAVVFLIIIKDNLKMPTEIYYLFILLLISIILFFWSSNFHNWISGVAGYYNLAVGTYITFYILNNYYKLFEKILIYSLLLWLLIGLIQIFYDRTFGMEYLNRMTLNSNRGVNSLSAEPTTFAITLLFYLLIIRESLLINKKYITIFLLLIMLFFTQSSLVIMLSFIYIGYYAFIYLSLKKIVYLSSIIVLSGYIINMYFGEYYRDYRILELIMYIYEDPFMFFLEGSVNARISAIFFPILGFVKSLGLPHGFGNYSEFLIAELPKYDFFGIWVTKGDKIMSFYASSLYELGLFGLILIVTISTIIYNRYKKDFKYMLLTLLCINTLLFMAMPLSNPFVSMYLAILLYRSDNETPNNPK